ncbi:hypothetical protein [Enterococcus ureilyticus]|nr:hypothetical protein [Enterococcus ureilyticus]MBO0447499.1 hypothetical protein [Enterococcus ureilyticus]
MDVVLNSRYKFILKSIGIYFYGVVHLIAFFYTITVMPFCIAFIMFSHNK